MQFSKLAKVEIIPNTKRPSKKWSNPKNHLYKTECQSIAFLTGKINNFFVVDIDVKDGGLNKWNDYIKVNGDPQTITVKSPSGGFHYYFKNSTSNEGDKFLLEMLQTTTGIHGCIDIRREDAIIIAPPTNNYVYVRDLKTELLEIPSLLLKWLLVNKIELKKTKAPKATINQPVNNNLTYIFTDEKIKNMLSLLPDKYINNYIDWLLISTCLKSIDSYNVWDEWCKKSTKYDKDNNLNIWNSITANININYLATITKSELIESYKPYEPITKAIALKTNTFNNQYVSNGWNYNNFKNEQTTIIKSCTGTGKTTAMAKNMSLYLKENPDFKLLSIVAKISLAEQHVKSFNDENINIVSYQNNEKDLFNDNLVICINSLMMYSGFSNDEFKNYIVYIDEINSLIESLTHNTTIDKNVKVINQVLMKIIKNAHKVVVSDALISDNVFTLLNARPDENKIYYVNEYKKFEGVKAYHMLNENDFLNKLLEHCNNDKPFLFGSDSCKIITEYYYKCLGEANENDKDKYILITAENKFMITDANKDFKDKFVFYSPSLVYGVDFNITDKQDVFIFSKGESILPSGLFQQTTRTRQINKLYVYCNARTHEPQYNTIDDVYKYYDKIENVPLPVNVCCVNTDENDNNKICKNTFYKLFAYNEFVIDTYKTNTKMHFLNILKDNKFIVNVIGEKEIMVKTDKLAMTQAVKDIKEELFNEFIDAEDQFLIKYKLMRENMDILKLVFPDNQETLQTYKDEIIYAKSLSAHFNLIKLMKSDEYVNKKVALLNSTSYQLKTYKSVWSKIQLLREFESLYNIDFLDVEFIHDDKVKMKTDFFNKLHSVFGGKTTKPKDANELKVLYVSMIRSITDAPFIDKERTMINGKRNFNYSINKDVITYHNNLLDYRSNNSRGEYHKDALKIINVFDVKAINMFIK